MGWFTLYNIGDDPDADHQYKSGQSELSKEQYESLRSIAKQHGTAGKQKPPADSFWDLLFGSSKPKKEEKKKGFWD